MRFLSTYDEPGTYAFHKTSPENVDSIRERGIQRSRKANHDTTDIVAMLDELGFADPFPFDRENVVYCHVDADYVSNTTQMNDAGLLPEESIIVIDVSSIDVPMYVADMSILTDLIDYKYAGAETMLYADTPEEVVDLYRESIKEVITSTDIAEYTATDVSHAELVIDGDIPPTAIETVLTPT